MSDVQQQDFDMIHAKLSQWREDPGVEGFACILIARRSKKEAFGANGLCPKR